MRVAWGGHQGYCTKVSTEVSPSSRLRVSLLTSATPVAAGKHGSIQGRPCCLVGRRGRPARQRLVAGPLHPLRAGRVPATAAMQAVQAGCGGSWRATTSESYGVWPPTTRASQGRPFGDERLMPATKPRAPAHDRTRLHSLRRHRRHGRAQPHALATRASGRRRTGAAAEGPEGLELLLTRSASLRSHAGQIALPGGRVEPGESFVTAAIVRRWKSRASRADRSRSW